MRTLLVDNYDSYTHIIAQYLWKVNGEAPIVIKNDAMSVEALKAIPFDNIVISPGPGTPERREDVGVCLDLFDAFPDTPILGVCLGHQCMAQVFGGRVVRAPKEMHGKYSTVHFNDTPLFDGIDSSVKVVRYHSLIADRSSLPESLRVTGETDEGIVMALQHNAKPYFGVQFHPESIGTEAGERMIDNFRRISERWIRSKRVTDRTEETVTFRATPIEWTDPERAFAACFADGTYACWLDSSLEGRNGRFSFMGGASFVVSAHNDDVAITDADGRPVSRPDLYSTSFFDVIEECLHGKDLADPSSDLPFQGGFVGYAGYESTRHLDIELTRYDQAYPECLFMWIDRFLAFDHENHVAYACSATPQPDTHAEWVDRVRADLDAAPALSPMRLETGAPAMPPPLPLTASRSKQGYIDDIATIKEYLREGETYEVCLTNEFAVTADLDPFELYRVLRLTNPAPYSAYLKLPEVTIHSSSPECFLTLDDDRTVKSEPIKGTRAKGANAEETARIREGLAGSTKDHSELLMIIDLIRNDLSTCCDRASVQVSDFMKITEYATVLQLSSVVEGKLRPTISAVELLRRSLPGGSITGAPKYRTMQIIDELEQRPRGVYTGSIGYLSLSGHADFNIAIRTLVQEHATDRISFGSGGAVVAESDAEDEYDETLVKAYALLRAIYLAKYGAFESYHLATTPVNGTASTNGSAKDDALEGYMTAAPDLDTLFQVNEPA